MRLFKGGYVINGNENRSGNEKQIKQIQHEQTSVQTYTQIYQIQKVPQYKDGYMY